MTTLLLLASLLFLLALVYPFVIYPFLLKALASFSRRRPLETSANRPLRTDIVICAYNEEVVIGQKIENCLRIAAAYPDIRIHVYSDGSSDGTAGILKSFGDRIDAVISTQRQGKSVGMNTLLERCEGDIVVFTDANVMITEATFGSLWGYFVDPSVGCVCGNLNYTNTQEGNVAEMGAQYWRGEERLKHLETQIGSAMGADGALFAIRTKLFRTVPADIIDDMFTSMSIALGGHRIVQALDFSAAERSTTRNAEEFRRKVRIACRAFNCHRLLSPQIWRMPASFMFCYVSHKLLRWLSGFWLVLATIFLALWSLSSQQIWLLALLVLGAAILLVARWRPLGPLTSFAHGLEMMLATSWGVIESLRGKRYQTWSAAPTSRSAAGAADGQS